MRKWMLKEDGFTLIELLIVLAIMGILVGIVAMSVGNLTDTAQTRGMESERSIVQTAIDTYNTQDVLVDNAAAIAAQGTAAQVDKETVEFGAYLKQDTKYEYTWGAGGISLTVTAP